MAIFRPSRTRRGPDPYLPHKMVLFALGTGIAFTGIALERRWLVTVGIAVLLVGFVLRFFRGREG